MLAPDRGDPTAGRSAVVLPDGPLPPLPASTWESREVREALGNESPGAVVAFARRAHGLRQDELGTLAGFSQSAISRLESGSNIAYDMRVLRTLQRLLGIPAHLLGLVDKTVPVHSSDVRKLLADSAEAPGFASLIAALNGSEVVVGMDGRALMSLCAATVFGGVSRGGALDDDAVAHLLVLRRIVNDAHNWRGSSALMPAVRSMYDFIELLRRAARGDQRRRLLGVAAMYAEFYGWLHEEIGDAGGASRWTARAMEQGQAADDRDVVAYSYVRMSQLAEADGDDDRVIGLARAAQRERGLSHVVRAMALHQEARGLARAGDDACLQRLDGAQLEMAKERERRVSGDGYHIGYCFTEQNLDMQRAASLLELGRLGQAIVRYEDVRHRWGHMCLWEQGVHTAKLAYAHAANGDPDQAAELGFAALEMARSTGSGLVVNELRRLGAWAGAPAVADLVDAVRQVD
jgi:transcriptional regulator with XRE-family HTH domain